MRKSHFLGLLTFLILINIVYSGYLTPQHVQQHIKRLINQKYQLYVINLGTTVNNNPLKAYVISGIKKQQKSISQLLNYPATLITSYMHPRQPYSIKLIQTVIDDVLNNYNSDYYFKYMLDHTLLIIFPFVNIDGYYLYQQLIQQNKPKAIRESYRKNLNKYGDCKHDWQFGVDINRNFDSAWGSLRTSDLQCSEEYRGPNPFSEKETKAIRTLYNKFKINLAIDIHSYGNQWIYPYASQTTTTKIQSHKLYPLYKDLFQYFKQMKRPMKGCFQSLGYTADGVYIDWALDQGALSFAVQVGTGFDGDVNIGGQVLFQAQELFHRVLRKNSVSYSKFLTVNRELVIRSTSLLDFEIQVVLPNGDSLGILKLQSGKRLVYGLDDYLQKVLIRVIDTKIEEEITLRELKMIEDDQESGLGGGLFSIGKIVVSIIIFSIIGLIFAIILKTRRGKAIGTNQSMLKPKRDPTQQQKINVNFQLNQPSTTIDLQTQQPNILDESFSELKELSQGELSSQLQQHMQGQDLNLFDLYSLPPAYNTDNQQETTNQPSTNRTLIQ